LQKSSEAGEGGSAEQSGQSAANIQQSSFTSLGGVWKSALSAMWKGWIKQEIITQFKLAIPVVSVCTDLNKGGHLITVCTLLTSMIAINI
jgi:hypothetical protein